MTLTRKDNLVHLGLAAPLANELETQVAPLADPHLTAPNLIQETAADGVVAHAGGGQANATPIITQTTRVTTVASPGDSIVLPASQPGLELIIINHGPNPMQVYGLGSDTINDVAAATGVSQMQGSVVIYTCVTAGAWYTEGLATGYATGNGGAFQTFSSIDTRPVMRVTDEHRQIWPKQYEAFKAGQEIATEGTPLEAWPRLRPNELYELKALGFRTVEHVANMDDQAVGRLGHGGRVKRRLAPAFIDDAARVAEVERLAAENDAKDAQIEDLRLKLRGFEQTLQRVAAGKELTPPPPMAASLDELAKPSLPSEASR